jgi:two-component system OmpR family response regulator
VANILIVDDDVDLAVLLAYVLEREGHHALVAHSTSAARAALRQHRPDLMILDIGLPDASGEQLLAEVRQPSTMTPPSRASRPSVLMLSGADREDTMVHTMRMGADDYVTKPFRPRLLLARIEALLRRLEGAMPDTPDTPDTPGGSPPNTLLAGAVALDLSRQEAFCDGRPLALTPTELRLLHYLLLNTGQILTFAQLIRHVWGYSNDGNEALLRVHVSRLRRKLERSSSARGLLVSRPRVGYGVLPPRAPLECAEHAS